MESFGIMTFDLDLGQNHKWANISVDLRQFDIKIEEEINTWGETRVDRQGLMAFLLLSNI